MKKPFINQILRSVGNQTAKESTLSFLSSVKAHVEDARKTIEGNGYDVEIVLDYSHIIKAIENCELFSASHGEDRKNFEINYFYLYTNLEKVQETIDSELSHLDL